jgi:hypothetical protein
MGFIADIVHAFDMDSLGDIVAFGGIILLVVGSTILVIGLLGSTILRHLRHWWARRT